MLAKPCVRSLRAYAILFGAPAVRIRGLDVSLFVSELGFLCLLPNKAVSA